MRAVMVSETQLAIKVDVDTRLGAGEGLLRLRDIFEARGIKASFFLSLGPDNSGRALRRVFTRPGFLAKMIRTRAPGAYGWRTLLYGTLIPAPLIWPGLAGPVRDLLDFGHEVGLHAWDHVTWHDYLWKMSRGAVRAEVRRGLKAFSALVGTGPQGFAAPAWRINVPSLAALEKAGLVYMSATRGTGPYWPSLFGHRFHLLEIPTTLPTSDEVLGRGHVGPDNLCDFLWELIMPPGLHVLTVHAEMEGHGLAPAFENLLDRCLDNGVSFFRLIDIAQRVLARPEGLPVCEIIRKNVPGRAGRVSYQSP